MRVEFNVKYGENTILIPLGENVFFTYKFKVKYGENVIFLPFGNGIYKFKVKYGKNVLELPEIVRQKDTRLSDLWKTKVTIYNDIDETPAEDRHFDRFVLNNCQIQGGFVTKADGTIENIANAKTVITRNVDRYKSPEEYKLLPVDLRKDYYTARSGDFIVFAEVDDVVTTAQEFKELRKKYKDNGITITTADASINGFSVDNVAMTNA